MVNWSYSHHFSSWKVLLFIGGISLVACQCSGDQQLVSLSEYLIAYNVAVDSQSTDYDVFILDPVSLARHNVTNLQDVAWTYLAINDQILMISDRDTCERCFYLYELDLPDILCDELQTSVCEIAGWAAVIWVLN
jgi:hypothetical protein